MNPYQADAPGRRIAYLVNQYPKISHTFIRNEIAALESAGFEVLRIAVRGWDAELVDPADIEERASTTYLLQKGLRGLVGALAKSFLARPLKTFKALRLAVRMSFGGERSLPYHLAYLAESCMARELTGRHRSEHVHAHFGSNATEVAMLLKQLGGLSFSFTVHGPEEFDKPYQLKLREKIGNAAFVAGVSSFGRSQLYRFSAVEDWPKIHVVHCGLGSDYLDAEDVGVATKPRLVCVGRLCEQKGQLVLVRACSILAARGIDFEVVLAGDGEMRAEVEREIRATGMQAHVSITGWLGSDAIRALLKDSKGLVLPSFAEGLPVVIMEAMSLGRPVISTYVAGIPELVRDGIDGFLVFAGSEEHLADAMARLLELDEDSLREMGTHARARAIERHSAVTEAAKLGQLFRDVAEGKRLAAGARAAAETL